MVLKVWKGTGYGMVVYLASITGIDGSLYEAAMLDGASKWQQAKHITLPMLKTVIVMMFILSVGGIFASDFGLFYQVPQNQGVLYSTTDIINTYTYRALLNGSLEKSAAIGLFNTIVNVIMLLIVNAIARRVSEISLW